MPRYKLTIEYDGTPFVGWQMQDNGPSVQSVLTDAIAAFAGERAAVQGAGRTDAGVHALGQVAHVDLAKDWDNDTVRDAINFHLRPQPVAVLAAEQVEPISMRVSRRSSATISIASSIAGPILRSTKTGPGACRARLIAPPCTPPRKSSSASTTSPPFAPPNARRSRRSRRSIAWMSCATATRCAWKRRRAHSCIIRCAPWSARWCTSAKANGAPTILPARSPLATARPAARSPRRMGLYLVRVEY